MLLVCFRVVGSVSEYILFVSFVTKQKVIDKKKVRLGVRLGIVSVSFHFTVFHNEYCCWSVSFYFSPFQSFFYIFYTCPKMTCVVFVQCLVQLQ